MDTVKIKSFDKNSFLQSSPRIAKDCLIEFAKQNRKAQNFTSPQE